MNYETVAEELKKRITALVPLHPEIAEMDSPWRLFDIDEFQFDDLQSSFAQAVWALRSVQADLASS